MYRFLDFWNLGFWILGSFAFPVLLFDTNAASENEPKSYQQKSRFRTVFLPCFDGVCVSSGGEVTIYIYIHIIIDT